MPQGEAILTGHSSSIREEVARIGNQYDQAALDLGKPTDQSILEQERCADADKDTKKQTTKEDEEEITASFEVACDR